MSYLEEMICDLEKELGKCLEDAQYAVKRALEQDDRSEIHAIRALTELKSKRDELRALKKALKHAND